MQNSRLDINEREDERGHGNSDAKTTRPWYLSSLRNSEPGDGAEKHAAQMVYGYKEQGEGGSLLLTVT